MNTSGRRVWLWGVVCALVLALMGTSGYLSEHRDGNSKGERSICADAAFADGSGEGKKGVWQDKDTVVPPNTPNSPGPSYAPGERREDGETTTTTDPKNTETNTTKHKPVPKITKHGKLGQYGERAVAFAFDDTYVLVLQRNRDLLSINTETLLLKASPRVKAKRKLRNVRAFTQNAYFGCAHLKDNSVRCWGEQVGDYGSTSCPDEDAVYAYGKRPQRINLPKKTNAFRSGRDLSCASSHKGIHCWGDRFGGTDQEPKLLKETQGYTLRTVTNSWVCAEKPAGQSKPSTTDCWRIGRYAREQKPSLSFKGAPRIHGTEHQICAVTQENQITCYDDDTPQVPLKITGFPKDKEVLELRGQSYIGCARLNDNTARCWGSFFDTNLEAFKIPELGKITALAVDNESLGPICALRKDTSIWCIDN